jgi:hypothetical protein
MAGLCRLINGNVLSTEETELEFLNNLWGARNRLGIGLSYRPARLRRLAEFIPLNRFLGYINVKKYRLGTDSFLYIEQVAGLYRRKVMTSQRKNQRFCVQFVRTGNKQLSRKGCLLRYGIERGYLDDK